MTVTIAQKDLEALYDGEGTVGDWTHVAEQRIARHGGHDEMIVVVRHDPTGRLYGITLCTNCAYRGGYPWTGTTGPVTLTPIDAREITTTRYEYRKDQP